MSDTLHPPLRISTTSIKGVTGTVAQTHLATFLESYHDRMATKGGDSTVTTQLHKLKEALAEKKLRGETAARTN